MGAETTPGLNPDSKPVSGTEPGSADSALDRRFQVALGLYAVLGALVWFTLDGDPVLIFNRPVELRLVVLVVLGGFLLRTVLARQAEKIRRGGR